jgi:sporulation-control protein
MFDKVLASIGIGSAKVDTRLQKATYRQGEWIKGQIFVQGGRSEQQIDAIYLYLMQQNMDDQQGEVMLDEFLLTDSFTIAKRETKTIPFQFRLPYDTPVSTGSTPIYLKTGLDVQMAVDPKDEDGFEVLPHEHVDRIIQAVEQLDFHLSRIDFDYEMFHERLPFVQKFHFQPKGTYANILDELSLAFQVSSTETTITMQVNLKAINLRSSMEEALNMDERFARFTISSEQVDLTASIEQNLRGCIS